MSYLLLNLQIVCKCNWILNHKSKGAAGVRNADVELQTFWLTVCDSSRWLERRQEAVSHSKPTAQTKKSTNVEIMNKGKHGSIHRGLWIQQKSRPVGCSSLQTVRMMTSQSDLKDEICFCVQIHCIFDFISERKPQIIIILITLRKTLLKVLET